MAGSGHERNGHGGVTGETGLQPDAAENEGFHAAAEVLRVPPELVPAVRGHLTELGLIDPGAEIAVDALAALQRLTAEGDVQVGAITELLAARQRLTGTLLRSYPDASISGVDTIPVEVLAPGGWKPSSTGRPWARGSRCWRCTRRPTGVAPPSSGPAHAPDPASNGAYGCGRCTCRASLPTR